MRQVATMEVYNPGTGTWQVKPAMLTARVGSGEWGGEREAVRRRGHRPTPARAFATNEVYTPGDMWVTKSSMPAAREAFAAAVVSGKLYAFGGRQNGNRPRHGPRLQPRHQHLDQSRRHAATRAPRATVPA